MRFHPQRWAKVYDHWMGGIQDWCISRQLWWGHRIPVWRRFDDLHGGFNDPANLGEVLLQRGPASRLEKEVDGDTVWRNWALDSDTVIEEVATTSEDRVRWLESHGFTQDPDVLDTWFSSWLWPFATMGWPEQTPTLKAFYPTTDLVTGPDIIFFWVARMIMAGYEFMGDLPFQNVYFTGIIRDKQGRKMSKSLGNSPDPLDLIAKFGADALRFGTMRSAPLGQDILFDEQNVELGRNFCNKLWNACRFRQMVGGTGVSPVVSGVSPETFEVQAEIDPKLLTSDDKWILLKLDQAIREMNTAFADYKFSDATGTLYRFFWSEYCDWYVEASKAVFFGNDAARKANTLAVIDFVLSHMLRLFHPFLPFITEELWHGMGYAEDMPENQGGQTIMFAPWPKPLDDDFKSHYGLTGQDEKYIEARNELVTQGRNLRRTANIAASKKIKFIVKPARELAAHDVEVLKLLLNAEAFEVSANYQPGKNTMTVRAELGDLFLPLEGLIDKEAETARLKKELEKIEAEAAKVEQKLANPNFTQKVPANVLAEHKQRLADWQAKGDHVKSALAALQG
jgi:valyl-tRNA synthetase